MPSLETVAVKSQKDPSQKWVINRDDYDPSIHQLWESSAVSSEPEEPDTEEIETNQSSPDFVEDNEGNIVSVFIIDPEKGSRRLSMPIHDYNPDIHKLWSSHPRFNR